MSPVYVDATTLIALDTVGELGLLDSFDGTVHVPDGVREEVTTDPASTNVERLCSRPGVNAGEVATPGREYLVDAQSVLNEDEVNGDVELVGAVLMRTAGNDSGADVGVISDDARVRAVSAGLGATVTGTVGVVVRAVEAGLAPGEAKDLVRRIDAHGLHMTGELRETAFRLFDDAAEE